MADFKLSDLLTLAQQPQRSISPLQDLRMRPEGYDTKLPLMDEFQFRNWVQQNKVPFDVNAQGPTDYDMRGYYRGLVSGDPKSRQTEINQNDMKPHYTDYYKTPLHQSFSASSRWAGPGSPEWVNDHQLASPSQRIVFDERK